MTDEKRPDADEVSEEILEDVSGGALTVGKPKDKHEREADKIADQVSSELSEKDLDEVAGGVIIDVQDYFSEDPVQAPEITNPAIRSDPKQKP